MLIPDSIFQLYLQQGHTASLTHRVQRSYGLGWDIRADHPDVPASIYHFSEWEEAQPKNLQVDFEMVLLHCCRNLEIPSFLGI